MRGAGWEGSRGEGEKDERVRRGCRSPVFLGARSRARERWGGGVAECGGRVGRGGSSPACLPARAPPPAAGPSARPFPGVLSCPLFPKPVPPRHVPRGGPEGSVGGVRGLLRKLPPPPPPRVLTPVAQATTAFPPLTAADRAARILRSRLAGCAA